MINVELTQSIQEDMDIITGDIRGRFPDLDADRDGTLLNAVAGGIALAKRDAQRDAIRLVAKTFVAAAEGADLDRLAADHFGDLARHAASAATGTAELVRSVTDAASIASGTILTDSTGAQFTVTATTAVAGKKATVPVRAVQTGTAGNRVAGTLLYFRNPVATTLSGASIICREPLAGGNAGETDPAFRQRIALWWRALRRGTVDALVYTALSVPEVRRATVDESHQRPEEGGYVSLYVTDQQDGYSSELGRLVREAIDRDSRAAGIVVNVYGAEVVYAAVTLKIVLKAGYSSGAIDRAIAGIRSHANSLASGEPLLRAAMEAAALKADSGIASVQILTPPADVAAAVNQVIRLRAGDVTPA